MKCPHCKTEQNNLQTHLDNRVCLDRTCSTCDKTFDREIRYRNHLQKRSCQKKPDVGQRFSLKKAIEYAKKIDVKAPDAQEQLDFVVDLMERLKVTLDKFF